jgi:transcriptional regulator with XRE-family HTH domain
MSAGDGLIRRAREARDLTQADLARLLRLNPTSVSDAERRGPSTTTGLLERYGAAMGLELVVLYRTADGDFIE